MNVSQYVSHVRLMGSDSKLQAYFDRQGFSMEYFEFCWKSTVRVLHANTHLPWYKKLYWSTSVVTGGQRSILTLPYEAFIDFKLKHADTCTVMRLKQI